MQFNEFHEFSITFALAISLEPMNAFCIFNVHLWQSDILCKCTLCWGPYEIHNTCIIIFDALTSYKIHKHMRIKSLWNSSCSMVQLSFVLIFMPSNSSFCTQRSNGTYIEKKWAKSKHVIQMKWEMVVLHFRICDTSVASSHHAKIRNIWITLKFMVSQIALSFLKDRFHISEKRKAKIHTQT